MKFTETFKKLLTDMMKENECDCIKIYLEENEDHSMDINIGLLKKDEANNPIDIDGICVEVDEETASALQDATFSADGDQVTIDLGECGCGHHHHHHHEGECCCGDDDCCCK